MEWLAVALLFFMFDAGGSSPAPAPVAGGGAGGGTGGAGGGGPSGGSGPVATDPAPKSGPATPVANMFDASKAADWWGQFAKDHGLLPEGAALLGELAWSILLLAEHYTDVVKATGRPEDATTLEGARQSWATLSSALQIGTDGLEASPGNATSTERVVGVFKEAARLANALSTLLDDARRLWAQRQVYGEQADARWSIPPAGLLRFARDLGGSAFTDPAAAVAMGWRS